MSDDAEGAPPAVRPPMLAIDGNATAEEVAAVVAVLQGMAAAAASVRPGPRRRSLWADPARGVRRPVHPGPGAWRASALPY